MTSALLAPGQSMALACNSVAPMLCSASSSSSSSCAFSRSGSLQSGVAFHCPCILPSPCLSTSARFSPFCFPSMGTSDERRPTRVLKALALHSVFVSRSLDSSFFNGGAGFHEITGMIVFANISLNSIRGGALGTSMNIFDRVARVVRSYMNAVVGAAEDPEKILEQAVLDMNEDFRKMRQASAQVLASQKLMENKYKTAQQNADEWYRRAKLALQRGEEELAREALKRRKSYEDTARTLKSQLEQQNTVAEKIISNTRLLESKIQEAKSKKSTLKARAQSAKTASKVSGMLGNIDTSSALAAFERMEEKVNALEAEADAVNQLSTDDLAVKFDLLESNAVDDDLASLKREMLGTSKRADELPAGRSPVSSASSSPTAAYPFRDIEIEKELNDLRRKASDF